jgi:hypothetical protein
MKVYVKDLAVNMELGNKGISLDVYSPDGETRRGDVRFGKGKIEWCRGKSHTGPTVTWEQFITWMESQG